MTIAFVMTLAATAPAVASDQTRAAEPRLKAATVLQKAGRRLDVQRQRVRTRPKAWVVGHGAITAARKAMAAAAAARAAKKPSGDVVAPTKPAP